MKLKALGLLLIAVLITIAVVGVIRTNLEQNAIIPADDVGNAVPLPESGDGPVEGGLAPDFELKTLAGETIRLSDYKGKKLILNFWATWCPPCRSEMPHMQNYYEEQAEKAGAELLAVNLTSNDNGLEKIKEFVRDFGLTFPIPLDEKGTVGKAYEAVSIPTTYIIDTEGRIQHKIVGPMTEEMIESYIENLQ